MDKIAKKQNKVYAYKLMNYYRQLQAELIRKKPQIRNLHSIIYQKALELYQKEYQEIENIKKTIIVDFNKGESLKNFWHLLKPIK